MSNEARGVAYLLDAMRDGLNSYFVTAIAEIAADGGPTLVKPAQYLVLDASEVGGRHQSQLASCAIYQDGVTDVQDWLTPQRDNWIRVGISVLHHTADTPDAAQEASHWWCRAIDLVGNRMIPTVTGVIKAWTIGEDPEVMAEDRNRRLATVYFQVVQRTTRGV